MQRRSVTAALPAEVYSFHPDLSACRIGQEPCLHKDAPLGANHRTVKQTWENV
jgi:hypothetical protein